MNRSLPRFLHIGLLLGLLVMLVTPASAQLRAPVEGADETDARGIPYRAELPGPGGGLEEAVSGQEYRLGPGDILVLSVIGPKPMVYELPVTVEGKLLIPEVGVIDVDGVLLDDAKEMVRERVLRQYRGVEVTLNLTVLRRFQVHVLGQIESPGTYLATAVERVSSAVTWAGGMRPAAGQRRIQISNGGEIRATADLFAFFQRGDQASNPRLQDGDVILIPFAVERIPVLGAVNNPGPVEYLEGDRFSDMIRLAGGFSSEVAVDTVEVARYAKGSTDPQRFFVIQGGSIVPAPGHGLPELEMLGTFTPPAIWLPVEEQPVYPDFRLSANDMIFVRTTPNIRRQRLIEIQGEVRFPGQYPLTEGQTRLSEVIQWAGGITDEASLGESQLLRRESAVIPDRELERLRAIPVADMSEGEYNYFKMKSRSIPGLMVVSFAQALDNPGSDLDPLLERGDLIVVPKRKNFVTVLGMVANPGNIRYRPGLDAKQYIELAGGFAADAKECDSRVIRADGGEWVKLKNAGSLYPGDSVMIPEKKDRDYWRLFLEFLLVTTQLLAIYIVIDNATQ